MAKKQGKKKTSKKGKKPTHEDAKKKIAELRKEEDNQLANLAQNKELPADAKKKIEAIKVKLEKFQKIIVDKFDKYIMGITLLPPSKDPKEADKINVLILVDDTDSKKMSKQDLKEKLSQIIAEQAKKIDENMHTEILILSELWQSCYDGKHDYLQMIAMSAPVYDTGMLAAVKISEIHKTMVLKKFEKYIVSYVLAGSLVQGKATPKSDIDVFIVIDDTDVKKMSRAELKDKLRAIIIGMGFEAGKITGIEKHFNIQVYILTDFWDFIKEANPIIFTFLRDGIPFYDRGIFMPWKQLLKMGKIKPSPEAIDMFMQTGDSMIERIKFKIRDIGMEDIFYAILTPSQAALMMHGIAPPTPKETPGLLREIFVKKEKMLEEEYVKILEKVIQTRKDLEHGDKKEISGKEIDTLLNGANRFLKRLKELFTQIESQRDEQTVLHNYEHVLTVVRDVMKLEGVTDEVTDANLLSLFEKKLIKAGAIHQKYLRVLKDVVKAKKDYDAKKINKKEIELAHKQSNQLTKMLIEHIQRKRGRELERTKIRVKYGNKFGEVLLLGKEAFIIHDIDADNKEISHASIGDDGGLSGLRTSNLEELEKGLMKITIPPKVFVKQPIFDNLKDLFGKDVEILINY